MLAEANGRTGLITLSAHKGASDQPRLNGPGKARREGVSDITPPHKKKTEMSEQLYIFNDEQLRPDVKRPQRSGGSQHFQVRRDECSICRDLDRHPKSLFGEHLLISAAKAAVHVPLSEREKNIINTLRYEKEETETEIEPDCP